MILSVDVHTMLAHAKTIATHRCNAARFTEANTCAQFMLRQTSVAGISIRARCLRPLFSYCSVTNSQHLALFSCRQGCPSTDCLLCRCVTFATMLTGHMSLMKGFAYVIAQISGSACASLLTVRERSV